MCTCEQRLAVCEGRGREAPERYFGIHGPVLSIMSAYSNSNYATCMLSTLAANTKVNTVDSSRTQLNTCLPPLECQSEDRDPYSASRAWPPRAVSPAAGGGAPPEGEAGSGTPSRSLFCSTFASLATGRPYARNTQQ